MMPLATFLSVIMVFLANLIFVPQVTNTRIDLPNAIKDHNQRVVNLKHIVASHPGTLVAFVAVDCPVASAAMPALADALRVARGKGFASILVYPNAIDRSRITQHLKDYALSPSIAVYDDRALVTKALKATRTPEAFVMVRSGILTYQGCIDNNYIERSKPNGSGASQFYLRDAVLRAREHRGDKMTHAAVGCLIEPRLPTRSESITYTNRIAPILRTHCVPCHRPGQIGPMRLDTYAGARSVAANIADVVERRIMPPWKAVPGHGEFQDERRLNPSEIAALRVWADHGAVQGTPSKVSVPSTPPSRWELGTPDLVVKMPQAWNIPASGPDDYRCFVLPLGNDEDRDVVAVEYRAGNKKVVHHLLGYLDTGGKGRSLDAQAPGQGYTSFGGPGFVPVAEFGGWAPGNMPRFLPDGVARRLPKQSDLIVQVHYHPVGRDEEDVTEVGIYYAKRPVRKYLQVSQLTAGIRIPAGDGAYKTQSAIKLSAASEVLFVVPHMHLLGKKIRVDATLPSGAVIPMIRIDDWDFNWQDSYVYKSALRLPKDSVLTLIAEYDNSDANPRQQVHPPRAVTWGEATTDEMCIVFMGTVALDERDGVGKR